MKSLGAATNSTEAALNKMKVPPALSGITQGARAAEKAIAGMGAAVGVSARETAASARANELWYASANRIEKLQVQRSSGRPPRRACVIRG